MNERVKSIICPKCGRFLGKEDVKEGMFETQCPNCRLWITVITKRKDRQIVAETQLL